ncbi:MAG: DUF4209 domain-containing protein [Thermomicrobiales bacterium]
MAGLRGMSTTNPGRHPRLPRSITLPRAACHHARDRECDCPDSSERNRTFEPMVVYTDGTAWPDTASFTDQQLDHLAARANSTANPFIRAHYLDVLWSLRGAHSHGRNAFDAYLEAVAINPSPADAAMTLELQHAITRPLAIAVSLNDAALLKRARVAINSRFDQFVSRGEYRWTFELAKTMLLRANRVEQADLERAASCVELAAEHYAQQENGLMERSAYELVGKLRAKLRPDQGEIDDLRERWARSYIREGQRRESDSPMAASHAYMQALIALRSLGTGKFTAEIADLERRIKLLNEAGRGEAMRVEAPIEIDYGGADEFADTLLNAEGDEDLRVIALLDDFIPSIERIRSAVEEFRPETPLQFLFPRATIRDGNVVRRAHTEAEIFDDIVAESYGNQLHVNAIVFSRFVARLDEGRRWRRRRLPRRFRQSVFFGGRDLSLLDHAFRRYFARDYVSALVLLVLQVEPALRAILPLLGLPTTITDPREGVTREKNLDELLATDELAELLGKEYVFFVRFVLTDQRGPLLRHGTAHGLLPVEAYNEPMAHLLVYMLLWLTRFVPKQDAV